MSHGAPFIVRLAGLPAQAVEPLATALGAELCELDRLRQELGKARAAIVDRLHAAMGGTAPGLRRFLLEVKRDCFNGRPLERHRGARGWDDLHRVAGELPGRVLDLERRLAEGEEEVAASYRRERLRERRHLIALLDDRRLMRGIALASPDLAANAGRLRSHPESDGRRERRIEVSLARYATRAALKLSPYSTLTRLALGAVEEGREGMRLFGDDWSERSMLRLKRYLLDQYKGLLLGYRPLRDRLPVVLNDTLEEVAPGRFRWLRPGFWGLDPEGQSFSEHLDSFVTAGLDARLIGWLRRVLPAASCRELIAVLDEGLGEGEAVDAVDRLLRAGVLRCLWPWPSCEGHLEARLLETLRSLPSEEALRELVGALERLVALEKGYPEAPDPAASLAGIDRLIDEIWRSAATLGGVDPAVLHTRLPRGNLYEDVFLRPQDGAGERHDVLRVSRDAVREVTASLDPWVRFSALYSPRPDFLHALARFMAERWPGREEVGLLELFGALQPLWRDYMKHAVAARRALPWQSTFDPFDLPEVGELRRLREEVWKAAARCVRTDGAEQLISPRDFAAALAPVPELYAPPAGPCLFLQPADAAATLWVLNVMCEGTGRYGSRFTPVMDEAARLRYTAHFTACSVLDVDGWPTELLDLMGQNGDTLNVHAPQTPVVLEYPGERLDLPAERKVRLSDLRVRPGAPWPKLVDASGRRFLPVHLGGAGMDFMPTLHKFLFLLGPGELRSVFPERAPLARRDGVELWGRLTLGNVVVRRRCWSLRPDLLAERVRNLPDAEAFAAIHRWRLACGIPERVFVSAREERRARPLAKPQYIDFTSPVLVAVFCATLQSGPGVLLIEEMLPTPGAMPRDEAGRTWAVELLLDTLALGPGRRPATDPTFEVAQVPGSILTGEACCKPEPIPAH